MIDNYEGEDLKSVAKEKLELIKEQEKKENAEKLLEKKEMEINLDVMGDYDYLFEEEEIDEE